jgi:uncharacterized protein YpmS
MMIKKKWFIILICIVLIIFGYFCFTFHDVQVNQEQGRSTSGNVPVDVSLNKEQVNTIAKYYIREQNSSGNTVPYNVWVSNRFYVSGHISVLGQSVNYVLSMKPSVINNGDVKLVPTDLDVGILKLPTSFVLAYIGKYYKIPKWVEIDSSADDVILHLSRIGGQHHLSYQANMIDMSGDGRFKFKILFPNI